MMPLIKTIFLFCVSTAFFAQNDAMILQRTKKAINATTRYYESQKEQNFNQYTCQGYYECMGQMQNKEKLLLDLKSEQEVLLKTMSSVNKKALQQERMLNKLIPQNKRMKKEMEELNENLEECQEEYNKFLNIIAELEAQIDRYSIIVEETIDMCTRQVGSYELDRSITGVYFFSSTPLDSWWAAQNECRRHGMNLISIDSLEESIYISDKLIDDGILAANNDWVWLGLNNFETNDEDYTWVGTGEGTTVDTSDGTHEVNDWADDTQPADFTNHHCVGIDFFDAGKTVNAWYTEDCDIPGGYICELPPICYHLFEVEFSIK